MQREINLKKIYLNNSQTSLKKYAIEQIIKLNEINFKIKKYNMGDTIIIAGVPRSGTTWLTEILSSLPGYTTIFEPLHPVWFPESVERGFKDRTYLPTETHWFEGINYIEKVLSGRSVTNRFEGIGNLKNNMFSNKLVVKFVRANRLLPWISHHFKVRKIILLIRHPCAVVASQIRSGFYGYNHSTMYKDESPTKETILKEAQRIGIYNKYILKKIEGLESKEELLAASWCFDYYVPLRHPNINSWILLSYENLIIEPEKTIKRILELLNIKNTGKCLAEIYKPSKVASSDLKLESYLQLSKWRNYLSPPQIQNILDVVYGFGFEFYDEGIKPDNIKLNRIGNFL